MNKLNVLVFPCGSEIGLEVYRSLSYLPHLKLIGASSVTDHGEFVFSDYIGGIPPIDSTDIINYLGKVVNDFNIDVIIPTMDKVVWKLKYFENELGCIVIGPPKETTDICVSKKNIYKILSENVKIPIIFNDIDSINQYPVFVKPDLGYGSRGVFKAENREDLEYFFLNKMISDYVICEFLPGAEYTVDCFTDRYRQLRFCGPRIRNRISKGISVNTKPVDKDSEIFCRIARTINDKLHMRGAWFFQLKRDINGNLTLMEVASRLGGASSLYRGKGVNFALLSIYDALDMDIVVYENSFDIELDRALYNKYRINIYYNIAYIELENCIVTNGKVNKYIVSFLYQCINKGIRLVLVTKTENDWCDILSKHKLRNIFDDIIIVNKEKRVYEFLKNGNSIFIGVSINELYEIHRNLKMPVFTPDTIECLVE